MQFRYRAITGNPDNRSGILYNLHPKEKVIAQVFSLLPHLLENHIFLVK